MKTPTGTRPDSTNRNHAGKHFKGPIIVETSTRFRFLDFFLMDYKEGEGEIHGEMHTIHVR